MPFLIFSALLQFCTPNLACKMFHHNVFPRFTQICTPQFPSDRASHADDVVHQLRSIRLPRSSEQQSKLRTQRRSHCYGRYRVVALRKYSLLELLVEEEVGSGSPSVVWPNPKCLLYFCRDSGHSPQWATQSPSSAFHQKWQRLTSQAPQVPPGFQVRRQASQLAPSDAQSLSSLRKIVIVAGH